jgi:hypothetical protein
VTDHYPPGDTAFTGTIKLIELESGGDSHDHLIDPPSSSTSSWPSNSRDTRWICRLLTDAPVD